jgi:hypothetical protein
MKECIEGKLEGRSWSVRELVMHGVLEVIASVICEVNSKVVVLC